MSKNVKISAGRKDGIIVIEVTSTNPKLAADMANAFIDELDRLLKELAVQEAKGRLAFLEKERAPDKPKPDQSRRIIASL